VTELCPVCGKDRTLSYAPFDFDPQLPICPDCQDRIYHAAGCAQQEDCEDCPSYGTQSDFLCYRGPFALREIGYDPNVVYLKPKQLSLI